jgi:hypothetical protein
MMMLLASLGMVLLASLEIGLVDWRPGILGSVSWLCEDVYVLVVLLFYPVIRTGASSIAAACGHQQRRIRGLIGS